MAQIAQEADGASVVALTAPFSVGLRIAIAARLEMLRSIDRRGRLPDLAEIARAVEPVLDEEMRRREVEAQIAGETRVARQYCELLEEMLPKV